MAILIATVPRTLRAGFHSSTLRNRAATLAVLALAGSLCFGRLGERALWSMELRWAEIPREMVLTGDYFRPTINGHLYYDKPLGSYWLVLAASWLTGTIDEATARLPSAISGVVGVFLMIHLGRRLYDRRTSLLAGLILATSFSYVGFARTASADAETVAGTLAALSLFAQCERRPNGWWVGGLWAVMAVTSLTKGLLGFALPLLVLIADGALAGALRDRLRWLCGRRHLLAAALAALIYAAPFALSGGEAEQGLFMVFRENVRRFFDPVNHRGPVYLYAYVIFGLMAPWSLLLPAAIARAIDAWRSGFSRGDRFAIAYFGATFLFFTLAGSRRSYYLLPILPAAALLVARLLSTLLAELSAASRRLLIAGLAGLAVAVFAAGFALFPPTWVLPKPWADLPPLPGAPVFALGWFCCLGLITLSWRRGSVGHVGSAFACTAVLGLGHLYLIALPAVETYRDGKPFADRVRHRLGDDLAGLALFQTREPVFYLASPRPIPEFHSSDALLGAARLQRISWVIGRSRDLAMLGPAGTVIDAEMTHAWEDAAARGSKLQLVRLE